MKESQERKANARTGARLLLLPVTFTIQETHGPAFYHPALMVEGGRGHVSFHYSDAWGATDVGTQKVTAEHVTGRGTHTDETHIQVQCYELL